MMRADGDGNGGTRSLRSITNGSDPLQSQKSGNNSTSNGTRRASATTNGSMQQNGHAKPRTTYHGHDREELTRLLLQALSDLGYNGAAGTLSQESGYELESPAVSAFRNAVLQGEWAEAEEFLFGSSRASVEGGVSLNGSGLVLDEGVDRDQMRFWIRQQKFLEMLEERDTGRALMVLRTELTPLYQDVNELHFLSSLLMCQSAEDLRRKARWDGAHGHSRRFLLSDLSRRISPSVMIPEHRLAILLEQSKQAQISNCLYHNTVASPSLYADHHCDRDNFPLRVVHELDKHSEDVWQAKFSHDGRYFASCGADRLAVIYKVATWEVVHVLADHDKGVTALAWSPDDSRIVTGSKDQKARLWNTRTGKCLQVCGRFSQPVTSCVWAPDGQSFVTGSMCKEYNLCQWSQSGELLYDWGQRHRISDVAVSKDGSRLIAVDVQNHLHSYNFMTREREYEIDLKVQAVSLDISQDSKHVLVGLADGEVRMFDSETRELVKTFLGQASGEFVVHSSFGGANESFVISGSNDGHVFIWHKDHGCIIEKLEAHRPGCCSAVAWNPTDPCMFATGGDDMKVRVWSTGPPSASELSSDHNGASWRRSTEWSQNENRQ